MVSLPPELWWRIAALAGEVRAVRCLGRGVAALRPERTLLHQNWRWMEDVGPGDYRDLGEYLRDLVEDLDERVWPAEHSRDRRALYRRQAERFQPAVYTGRRPPAFLAAERRREHLRRVPRGVHEVYRLSPSVVRRFHRLKRWRALALVF